MQGCRVYTTSLLKLKKQSTTRGELEIKKRNRNWACKPCNPAIPVVSASSINAYEMHGLFSALRDPAIRPSTLHGWETRRLMHLRLAPEAELFQIFTGKCQPAPSILKDIEGEALQSR